MSRPGYNPATRADLVWPAVYVYHSDCGRELSAGLHGVIHCVPCGMHWAAHRLARYTDAEIASRFCVRRPAETGLRLVEVDDPAEKRRYVALRPCDGPAQYETPFTL